MQALVFFIIWWKQRKFFTRQETDVTNALPVLFFLFSLVFNSDGCFWPGLIPKNNVINTAQRSIFYTSEFGLSSPHIHPSDPGLHKSFKQIDLFLSKVQSLWSWAHCCKWFMGYLNHVDLFMLHVTACFKETALLFNVHLSCFVDFILCTTDKYIFKVCNKKVRLLTIKN